MTTYVKDNFLYSAAEVRVLLNASFRDGADLSEFGFATFVETEPPAALPNHTVVGSVVDNERVWTQVPNPTPVITEVTMRQARLALLQAGKLQQVNDAIAALPEPQKSAAQIEWEYAASVNRDSALLNSLAAAVNLSEQDLDDLFAVAAYL